MAQNVIINGVTYQNVPEVDIPKSGGGTAKFMDTTIASDGASAGNILNGKKGFVNGVLVTGNMANNGSTSGSIGTVNGTVAIPAGYTSGGTISLTNVSDCLAENILTGKSILGVNGSLAMPSISQDSGTKILSIS